MTATLISVPDRAVSIARWSAIIFAVLAVALSVLSERYGWLDYRPGGTAFDVEVRPVFTLVFVVAVLIALRWEIIGGALAAFVGAALISFAVNQLVATHAAVVIAFLAIPAILWVVIDLAQLSPTRALIGLGAAGAMTVAGFVAGQMGYASVWGPTHPESTVAALPPSQLEWVWSGRVKTTSAEVRAKANVELVDPQLLVSLSNDFEGEVDAFAPTAISDGVMAFAIAELVPDTTYYYAVQIDGQVDDVRSGRFRTFPVGPSSYTVAIGSCARVGSNGAVFDRIREADPLFYMIAGDLHYGDNGRNDVVRYQEVMDLTLALPAQSALYRSTPVAYMWDDHDYGGNDSDGSSASREAAMSAYRQYVPSYALSSADSAVFQAFTVGRVRYILTDARSARNPDQTESDDAVLSMLGAEQRAWLLTELADSSTTHELLVWLNPVPWIADEEAGADHWGGFANERRLIADHIVNEGIDNLLMISGDAHMVAVDDGTNSDYSTSGGGGFPVVHAAALDRPGSIKGGPYSEGAFAGGGQYATMEIIDDGSRITAVITALDWENNVLINYEFETPQ